jgi:hypothetical protein
MYTSCSGATCIYMSCLIVDLVYGQKYVFLAME